MGRRVDFVLEGLENPRQARTGWCTKRSGGAFDRKMG